MVNEYMTAMEQAPLIKRQPWMKSFGCLPSLTALSLLVGKLSMDINL